MIYTWETHQENKTCWAKLHFKKVDVPSLKLTLSLKHNGWKMNFLLGQTARVQGFPLAVKLQECIGFLEKLLSKLYRSWFIFSWGRYHAPPECRKPCKWWDKLPINWCRISSINSIELVELAAKRLISSFPFKVFWNGFQHFISIPGGAFNFILPLLGEMV